MKADTRRTSSRAGDDAMPPRELLGRLLGLGLLVVGVLLLTTSPGLVYMTWHRDGYQRTEARVEGKTTANGKRLRVQVASTGQTIDVKNTTMSGANGERVPIWFNPEARLVAGIELVDERIHTVSSYPELPGRAVGFGMMAATVALLGAGGALMFRRR